MSRTRPFLILPATSAYHRDRADLLRLLLRSIQCVSGDESAPSHLGCAASSSARWQWHARCRAPARPSGLSSAGVAFVCIWGGERAPSSAGGRFEFRRRLGSGCMWSLCDVCVFCGELVRIANAHPLCMLMRPHFLPSVNGGSGGGMRCFVSRVRTGWDPRACTKLWIFPGHALLPCRLRRRARLKC